MMYLTVIFAQWLIDGICYVSLPKGIYFLEHDLIGQDSLAHFLHLIFLIFAG